MTEQPTVTQREAIRQSIIRQLGDDPNADRIILPGTDWDIVLAALSPSIKEGEVERLFDVLWPLTEWDGDEEVCRIACRAALTAMRGGE